jgi:serine/threonine protein kinase
MAVDQPSEESFSSFNKVKPSDFTPITLLGEGGFASVYLVRRKSDQQVMALKIISKSNIKRDIHRNQPQNEKDVLSKVENSSFSINLLETFESNDHHYAALEYCPGGDLFWYLDQLNKFNQNSAQFYAACVLMALEDLHAQGIVYRE